MPFKEEAESEEELDCDDGTVLTGPPKALGAEKGGCRSCSENVGSGR